MCEACWSRLPSLAPPRCERCGATRLLDLPEPGRCPECADWGPELPRAAAPFRMDGLTMKLVHGYKYGGCFGLGRRMGAAMHGAARRLTGGRAHVLVPVPLSPSRRRERGFNQAELLARGLSERLQQPVRRMLRRGGTGRRQARLGRRARRENVRERFRLHESSGRDHGGRAADGDDRPVLLVDDVLTTGATAAACIGVLQEAGRTVSGVVSFARALHPIEIP